LHNNYNTKITKIYCSTNSNLILNSFWFFFFTSTFFLSHNYSICCMLINATTTLSNLYFCDNYNSLFVLYDCCNPNLGLVTKTRACKGASQKGNMGVTSHVPKSVGKCEGMNLHTPKWTPTLGIGVPMNSWIFIKQFQGSKPIGLRSSLYHWKARGR